MVDFSGIRQRSGQIGTIPVELFDPDGEQPDACIFLLSDHNAPQQAATLVRDTGLRVITSSGPAEAITASLLAEPNMPLVLCAIGPKTLNPTAFGQSRLQPDGIALINPPDQDHALWLQCKRLPPIAVFAPSTDQTAQTLTKALRKAGHRIHLDPLKVDAQPPLMPQPAPHQADQHLITMSIAALARGFWPH